MRLTLSLGLMALVLAAALAFPQADTPAKKTYTEEDGREYLRGLNAELLRYSTLAANAEWAYASNITGENLQNKV